MANDVVNSGNSTAYSNRRVETVIIPPADSTETGQTDDASVPAMSSADSADEESETASASDETVAAFAEENAAPVWLWPVSGSIERGHSMDRLAYDVTLRDWRTHSGIDIDAPEGSTVTATRGGTVESIVNDDLYGTVVTIDHGDGTKAVYANLASEPPVNVSDAVEPGYIIGAVGTSALAEVAQQSHLHFAVTVNGASVDPLEYLQTA